MEKKSVRFGHYPRKISGQEQAMKKSRFSEEQIACPSEIIMR